MTTFENLPIQGQRLHAGPLRLELDGIALRSIYLGREEVVRRIAPAIRDLAWGTVPPLVSDLVVEEAASSFRVSFTARHSAEAIEFEWVGTITGDENGCIRYQMDGTALETFEYNRIGLTIAHPAIQSGMSFVAARDGVVTAEGVLPSLIAPQVWDDDGTVHGAISPLDHLSILLDSGATAVIELTGDDFEIEDQRNWADGSYKTYSGLLAAGWPHTIHKNGRLKQSVALTVEGVVPDQVLSESEPHNPVATIELGDVVGTVPNIGIIDPGDTSGEAWPAFDSFAYVRRDVWCVRDDLDDQLESLRECAAVAGKPIELGLHLGQDEREGIRVLDALSGVRIVRVFLILEGFAVPAKQTLDDYRDAFPHYEIVVSTNGNFAELNRKSASLDRAQGLGVPITPTFHDIDGRSVIEGLESLKAIISTARTIGEGRVTVSSLTLRPRQNLFGEPIPVDSRIASTFAAGWLVAAIGQLAIAGIDAVTSFETKGAQGVIAESGQSHPVHSVLREIASASGADLICLTSDRPEVVGGIAFTLNGGPAALLANLREAPCTVNVSIAGAPADKLLLHRWADSVDYAAQLSQAPAERLSSASFELKPFEVALVKH